MPEFRVCESEGKHPLQDGDRISGSGCVRGADWRAGSSCMDEFVCLHMRKHVQSCKKISAVILNPLGSLHEFL